jgi:hypothetical protein
MSPEAVIVVAMSFVIVTAPDVPPPEIPVPAVTAVMSPTSFVTHVKSMSVFDAFERICPVVPPSKSAIEVATACPNVSKSAGKSVTRSLAVGICHEKGVVGFDIGFSPS